MHINIYVYIYMYIYKIRMVTIQYQLFKIQIEHICSISVPSWACFHVTFAVFFFCAKVYWCVSQRLRHLLEESSILDKGRGGEYDSQGVILQPRSILVIRISVMLVC